MAERLVGIARRLHSLFGRLGAYTIVSVAALGCDIAIYLGMTGFGSGAVTAGIIGYTAGLLLHYVLSTRYVFDKSRTEKTEARLVIEYFLSAVAGLSVTAAVIAMATEWLGAHLVTAKIMAVPVSFLTVYFIRCSLIFRASPNGLPAPMLAKGLTSPPILSPTPPPGPRSTRSA